MVTQKITTPSSFSPISAGSQVWDRQDWQRLHLAYLKSRPGIRAHWLYKRGLDLLIATVVSILLLPIMLAIAIAIHSSSPGGIFFCQERLGLLGKTFTIYKFRTMVAGAIQQGTGTDTYRGDPRVTAIGRFLREFHLDELPQLFNVLRGEMSLVGPRPLLPEDLPDYQDWEKRRLFVMPGITAWEAVNGGLDNTREQRFKLDVWYVDRWTIWLDLLILLKTIPTILRREGLYDQEFQAQLDERD
jgi:sugar transferase EpsL